MTQNPTYEELEQRVKDLEEETLSFRVADEKRKCSSQEWQTIFDAISDSVCMIDPDGTVTRCNNAMTTLLGKPYNEIIGFTCWELVHGTTGPIEGCPILPMRETRHKESADLQIGEGYFNVVVDPLFDEEGNIISAVHIISDVTGHKRAEEELRESEEKYREIASNMPGAVYQVIYKKDGSSYFTYISEGIEDIFDITPESAMENIDVLYNTAHEEDQDTLKQAIAESVQNVDEFSQELRFTAKNGKVKWCSATATPHSLENGDVLFNGVFFDITERKNAEKELRESKRFLGTVFDSIQDGISVLDHELTIIRTNQTMKNWYSEMLPLEGKKCYEAYHGRSQHCEICPTLRAIETGKLEMNEVPFTQPDGIMGALELFAFPMVSESGKPATVVEYVRDITERKRSENLLKEREQQYRSLFENNYSVMLLIDPDTAAIFDANPSACAYYGHSKETLTKMKITEINTLSKKEVFEEMERAKSENRNYFNFRHRLSNGTIRDVEVFSGPFAVSGKSLLCSIIHDISERKSAERERERLITELQKTLSEVQTLQGFLPICSSCKKIRDDKGYWNQIEVYIERHSDALFSHGLCPECMDKLYSDEDWYKK